MHRYSGPSAALYLLVWLATQSQIVMAQQCGWTERLPGTTPEASGGIHMVYDAARRESIVFTPSGETWAWNGVDWQLKSRSGPQPRINYALAYDLHRQRTVLFGGHIAGGETWEWDGAAWEFKGDFSSIMGSRNAPRMVYDPSRRRTVLFGGQGSNYYGDTWEWDGSNWVSFGTSGPSPRSAHAMGYDTARGYLMLVGGVDAANALLDDVWVRRGTTWQRLPIRAPGGGREAHRMAYNSDRQRLVLFGGRTAPFGGAHLGDLFEWDGQAWRELPNDGPAGRCCFGLSFDDARGTLVLFGGTTEASRMEFSDTWTWQAPCAPTTLPRDRWTVIVHGRTDRFGRLTYDDLTRAEQGWMWRLADRIRSIGTSKGVPVEIHKMNLDTFEILPGSDPSRRDAHHVLMFDWTGTSNIVVRSGNDGYAYAAGDALHAFLESWDADGRVQALIGHSRGAVVASETVQRLIARGTPPAQVIYLDGEGGDEYGYRDDRFNGWRKTPEGTGNRYIRFDNIFQPNGLGGHSLASAYNVRVLEFEHGQMPEYLIANLGFAVGRFVFRLGDIVYRPESDPYILNPSTIPLLFNWDFGWNSYAGWTSHGGGGTGVVEDHGLTLSNFTSNRYHSLGFVRPTVGQLALRVRRMPLSDTRGVVEVTWNGEAIYRSPIGRIPTSWYAETVDLPPGVAGTVGSLGVRLVELRGYTEIRWSHMGFVE